MLVNRVERGRYLDSVALMRASQRAGGLAGVDAAALMIGTPSNKALLREAGLLAAEGEQATPNDLIVAVRGPDAPAAIERALALLAEKSANPSLPRARGLHGALELLPGANLAIVSVPGQFAAREARRALERGLHVLVFSDNVAIEEEVALKRLAAQRGLLLMGPDCGTALIAGVPVAFANAVPRGDIGIVSASGTGLQEVACLVARLGGGVSHGIGVGGRDLDERVGGLATLAAIDALERDRDTAKIVLISKPPARRVADLIRHKLGKAAKPSVVCFLGEEGTSLRGAAEAVMGKKLAWTERPSLPQANGRVKGLYCGGTLCAEAARIVGARGDFIDLGADEYTRGRPHPMIEPQLRNEHVRAALADPAVGAVLLDVVLGFGSHQDPAAVLAQEKLSAKPVIASVTGTEQDPQVRSRQVATLRAAGVVVAPSNAHAAELAAAVVSGAGS
jgi:FdrA protein